MLFKHFLLFFIFLFYNNFLNICKSTHVEIPKPAKGLQFRRNADILTNSVLENTLRLNESLSVVSPNCVQIICKFICFNGKSTEIDKDIEYISKRNDHICPKIEELRLYSYEFADNMLRHGFLGNYSDKVEILYLACSNITDIEAGTFANGSFKEIYFEDLRLKELRKDFFRGITSDLIALSVIQKEQPLKTIYSNFLSYVKYQIKYLTLQSGLSSVRNLTGGEYLLNNLIYVDFSHNNFTDQILYTAFSKVSMIEHLDLSHSNLEYLPPYIFADFATTLDYLDISFNKLKTITHSIFGWRDVSRDLKIYANDNDWWCSCTLQLEMRSIFIYQRTSLVCMEPEEYRGWSVFDKDICDLSSSEIGEPTEVISEPSENNNVEQEITIGGYETPVDKSTEAITTTTTMNEFQPTFIDRDDLINLKCLASVRNATEHMAKAVHFPFMIFNAIYKENLQVDVVIDSSVELSDAFDLIWFNKVTTRYHKMEINYNEYGLGCYNDISYVTTVRNLMPNTAYTFCLVVKSHSPTSPFSCRSIYVRGNLALQYSAWLTKDQQITGLSLVIFGVILFSFAGILMIYLLLKRKPILLKGSKRVTTTHGSNNEIVVLPKDNSMQKIREKEEILARRGPFTSSQKRRNSTESVASYQSYINSNLYEVIPAYNKLHEENDVPFSLNLEQSFNTFISDRPDSESCYLTPLETVCTSAHLVKYAEIPYRAKRTSNDPLPEVPANHIFSTVNINEAEDNPEYAQVGIIYMLDSEV